MLIFLWQSFCMFNANARPSLGFILFHRYYPFFIDVLMVLSTHSLLAVDAFSMYALVFWLLCSALHSFFATTSFINGPIFQCLQRALSREVAGRCVLFPLFSFHFFPFLPSRPAYIGKAALFLPFPGRKKSILSLKMMMMLMKSSRTNSF